MLLTMGVWLVGQCSILMIDSSGCCSGNASAIEVEYLQSQSAVPVLKMVPDGQYVLSHLLALPTSHLVHPLWQAEKMGHAT